MLEPAVKFSVVIPTFNERALGFLEKNLQELSGRSDLEVICVDGGSRDGTQELFHKFGVQFKTLPYSNRAQRINLGISSAMGQWIVVLHPRSFLLFTSLSQIHKLDSKKNPWGAWTHAFDVEHPLLRFTSWYSNKIRGDQRSIFYLDHCWFFSRQILGHLAPPFVPEIDIFEDTEFCLKLKNISPGIRLPQTVVTSAVRFTKSGVWKQGVLNQILKIKYLVGINQTKLNQVYESGLELNGKLAASKDLSQTAKSSAEIQQ